ncbi:MAG TPA: GTPase Era [Bacteroidales bacterium]|nr:GTPase Era [Bacteroidales bacterium]
MHKAGFVNIVGNPNVGKSTLMNTLVGEKLSIITSKSQTTRHRIMGIVSGDDFQIVYSDTPGVLKPNYKLQESMLRFAGSALVDADVLLYVTDVYETSDKNADFLYKVKQLEIPVILILNKIDLSSQEKVTELSQHWQTELPKAFILPLSAQEKFGIDALFNKIIELLPESPAYFDKEELTDKSERFFVSEIIREKILINYKKEVPYSTEVEIDEFKEEEAIIRIRAIIYVERDSQKGIIIGHKGGALKQVGIQSRIDIEAFFEKKVHLELHVKVSKDWRDKREALDKFGYNNI